MKLWISVKEKRPCDFYSLILDDAITKNVIADAFNKAEGWFEAAMHKASDGWYWDDEDREYWKIMYWMPKQENEQQFLAECKERYPEFYKQHFEEGGSDE